MTALLELEPREADVEEIELDVDFEAGLDDKLALTRCWGCCVNNSYSDIATRSVTG
ncbi:hypothetical protein [Catenulispora subtropica]